MHNSKIKSLSKKIVSLLAASAVTCSQFTAVTPIKAAETEEPISNDLSGSLCGDADSNGIIDEADSTLIEEYLLTGADSSIDMIAADTDGDNKITLRDAELILQHTQGIVSSLPFTGEIEWKNYPDPANYTVINDGMTWHEAEEYCEKTGAHLAVITSEKEQAVITAMIKAQSEPKNNYWIGMERNENNEFVWITGEDVSYTNWNAGAPNVLSQKAVSIYAKEYSKWNTKIGKWDDMEYNCETPDPFCGVDNFGLIMENDGKAPAFHSWTDEKSLPKNGFYKLDCDVVSSSITVNDYLELDLNGHSISIPTITCKGDIVIRDSKNTGVIKPSSGRCCCNAQYRRKLQ